MTRQDIAWTHDGIASATLDVPTQRYWYGLRFPPVECGTSITVEGLPGRVTFLKREFADAGAGWVGVFKPRGVNLFGVHCFQRAVTSDIREVTFAWTNAVTDRKSHGGAVYFRDLRFDFEEGWTANELARPPVDPLATQYFPVHGQLTRRFLIYRGGAGQRARGYFKSPPNPPIDSFGPSRTPLHTAVGASEEARQLEIIASGKPTITEEGAGELGFYSKAMGVWMPHGDPKSYAHGGEDIYPFPRVGSTRWHEVRSDATAERQRIGALHPSGRPVEAHEWPSDFEYRCDRGSDWPFRLPPFRMSNNGAWQERKFNAGPCTYEADFATRQAERGYSAFDPHHGCRAILDALAHYYKTGCPLNRLRVQLAAQDYMTSFRTTQVGVEVPEYAGQHIPHSLHQLITAASRSPGSGGRIQREMGWISWTVAQAVAITPPWDPMRVKMKLWLSTWFTYMQLVRMKNGVFYAGWRGADSNEPWSVEAMQAKGWSGRILTPNEAELPVFQAGILLAGMDEAATMIGGGFESLIGDCARFIYGRPEFWVADAYNAKAHGPAWYTRVFANGRLDTEYTDGIGNAHTIHSRDSLCRAYRRTGDESFLDLACKVAEPIALKQGETAKQALARVYAMNVEPWGQTVRAIGGTQT